MDYQKLKIVLAAGHPVTGAYNADNAIAAGQMNCENCPEIVSRRVDERTILNEYLPSASAASAFLAKLETVAAGNDLVARVIRWLNTPEEQGGGLDVGNARVRAIAPGLIGQADITEAEVAALLALAETHVSRAAQLGLGTIYEGDIQVARAE